MRKRISMSIDADVYKAIVSTYKSVSKAEVVPAYAKKSLTSFCYFFLHLGAIKFGDDLLREIKTQEALSKKGKRHGT